MLFELTNKIAVVTGGAGLIGKECVKTLSEFGAYTYIAEINDESGLKVRDELRGLNLQVDFKHLDISSELIVKNFINEIICEKGKIDIWINNAYPRTADWGLKFEDIPLESLRENIDKHMNGYFLCCQKCAEQMKKQNSGSIINMASIYGMIGPDFSIYEDTQLTMPAAYSLIKGGIINFTRYLAAYYAEYNVRVNSISPGGIADNQSESFVKKYIQKTPLKRMGRPDDLSGGIIFLASQSSSYVTGHNLVIDGGWSII